MKTELVPQLIGNIIQDTLPNKVGPFRCLAAVKKQANVQRGTYVRIQQSTERSFFIGRLIDGPYFFDSNGPSVAEPVFVIELAATVRDGRVSLVQSRPDPLSGVYVLDSEAVEGYIGTSGDLRLGRLTTDPRVRVCLDSVTLKRHVGIFGTTGGGKSNSLQVLAEEAARKGFAVIIFDVEGEYVKAGEPTDELQEALREFSEQRRGVSDVAVYVPGSDQSVHGIRFSIPFPRIDIDVFCEILDLSPQERVMFLEHLNQAREHLGFEPYSFDTIVNKLGKRLEAQIENPTLPEAIAEATMSLYVKMSAIQRLKLLDANLPEADVKNVFVPGRVSIFDLSESVDAVRNLVIAYHLDKIFRAKIENERVFTMPILVMIEEVHTFLSKERRERMVGTLNLMMELARRGRKRGIALCLVSQQPSRLPPELLETTNTRIIHRLSSIANIKALKESTGNVPDSLWEAIPSLGKGQALVVAPSYNHAVVAQIRPAASKRLRID